MQRLQTPTASNTVRQQQQIPTSKVAERLRAEHEREQQKRSDAVRRRAREKIERQQAQLWAALETRSATRLQTAYRAKMGRRKAEAQDKANPGQREAIREAWLREEELRKEEELRAMQVRDARQRAHREKMRAEAIAKQARVEACNREREQRRVRMARDLQDRAEQKQRTHKAAMAIDGIAVQTQVRPGGHVAISLSIKRDQAAFVMAQRDAGLVVTLEVQPLDRYEPDSGAHIAMRIFTLSQATSVCLKRAHHL
jgi:hypothetical protein